MWRPFVSWLFHKQALQGQGWGLALRQRRDLRPKAWGGPLCLQKCPWKDDDSWPKGNQSFSHPRGYSPCNARAGDGRMNQKCKPENSQPARLSVRGQANSSLLMSVSLLAEKRLEFQFLPFPAKGVPMSQKNLSKPQCPHLLNGGNGASLARPCEGERAPLSAGPATGPSFSWKGTVSGSSSLASAPSRRLG